jgi:hypothetical protein
MKLSFSLGQYTTVFQAEVYAIKACAVENLGRDYENRNTYILSDSQAAIKKTLANTRSPQNWSEIATSPSYNWPDITELNWYGRQVMRVLLEMKQQIYWQEQDLNILSQDPKQPVASQFELSRERSETGRTEITHKRKQWESTTGPKEATGHISGPSARRTEDLLKLNRDMDRRTIYRILASKGTLFKTGIDG